MRFRRSLVALALAGATVTFPAAAAQAAPVPEGAEWSEATIPSADGAELHADVLRPKGLKLTQKTPVILSIGPYFNHSGQVGAAGPIQGALYDPVSPSGGPNERFHDFINGAKIFKRGYTWVQVDLRGFGGSTGCLDWGGPGEQADVVNAVQWAAKQPWSTGKVGMYGKSYDGVTGLIGVNKQAKGLGAVVSQEPVYDLYRYLYGDGMRRLNSVLTPALYNLIDASPGPVGDAPRDPLYIPKGANDLQRPGCKLRNQLDQTGDDDHFSSYWRKRNLIPGAKGSKVPLFITQGFTENNTVGDGLAQYLKNHTGPERAWLGPWEHVRGDERDEEGRLKMGRSTWYAEVMNFYDRHLKGNAKAGTSDPTIAVQTNDGKWRDERAWPPADTVNVPWTLNTGTFTDDGTGPKTGDGAEEGLWTISKPLVRDAHYAGSGKVTLDVSTTVPRANLVVDVYDLDKNGVGPLITRQGHMVRRGGTLTLDLWSADWKIKKGHRVGIRITDANDDWWVHIPTTATVTVHEAKASLPFLRTKRVRTIAGAPGTQLESYLEDTVDLSGSEVKAATRRGLRTPKLRLPKHARKTRKG